MIDIVQQINAAQRRLGDRPVATGGAAAAILSETVR